MCARKAIEPTRGEEREREREREREENNDIHMQAHRNTPLRHTDTPLHRQMHGDTEKRKYKIQKHADRQTGKQADRQTSRQAGRQIHPHIKVKCAARTSTMPTIQNVRSLFVLFV